MKNMMQAIYRQSGCMVPWPKHKHKTAHTTWTTQNMKILYGVGKQTLNMKYVNKCHPRLSHLWNWLSLPCHHYSSIVDKNKDILCIYIDIYNVFQRGQCHISIFLFAMRSCYQDLVLTPLLKAQFQPQMLTMFIASPYADDLILFDSLGI